MERLQGGISKRTANPPRKAMPGIGAAYHFRSSLGQIELTNPHWALTIAGSGGGLFFELVR
jgi:hypothetical protein